MSALSKVQVPAGEISYRDTGTGPVVLLVHGLLVDGSLWDTVAADLTADHRVLAPDLPLGAHRRPMHPDADLSPAGLATVVADFMAALDLSDVTLVGNDTGGAICQLVAADHPQRLARLVLTNCDAYRNFLPAAYRPLQALPRLPGGMGLARRLPGPVVRLIARPLTVEPLPRERLAAWLRPHRQDPGVLRDLGKVLRGITTKETLRAIAVLRRSDRPTLLAWGRRDVFFRPRQARRLAADIPGARLEWIEDARTFVPIDAPARLSALIRDVVAEGATPSPPTEARG